MRRAAVSDAPAPKKRLARDARYVKSRWRDRLESDGVCSTDLSVNGDGFRLAWPPRAYVERMYNVQRWTVMPRGGHFAALEAPDLLIDDLRVFARGLRERSVL